MVSIHEWDNHTECMHDSTISLGNRAPAYSGPILARFLVSLTKAYDSRTRAFALRQEYPT